MASSDVLTISPIAHFKINTWIRLWLALLMLVANQAVSVTTTPEDKISQLWDALSRHPNHRPDISKLERLFHTNGVVFGARYKDATPSFSSMPATDFIKGINKVSDKGFFECEVYRTIKVYDRFATAYSVVESRTSQSAHSPDFVGVNSIQLYKEQNEWKIISLYYQVEHDDLAIPLETGSSGTCIASP